MTSCEAGVGPVDAIQPVSRLRQAGPPSADLLLCRPLSFSVSFQFSRIRREPLLSRVVRQTSRRCFVEIGCTVHLVFACGYHRFRLEEYLAQKKRQAFS